ncbi:MAG: response regulator [Bacteroidota bacterium]|nr:response regulator [Bacteroidota bacterium]
MARERLKLLFERFESFASRNVSAQSGTGIGLSLTKELVELHHASIDVESETGKGSAFSVIFRKGNSHFGSEVEYLLQDKEPAVEAPEVSSQISTEAPGNIVQSIGGADEQAKERFSILIAEDNSELRAFLKSSLCEQYEIYEAENGREACELALSYVPDLIISDIMMTDMDGIALARIIKQDLNTSHIPFILLTAKTDMETKLDAMALCVDDYITKPFSLTYLEARIENLLKIREQLQSYFKSSLSGGVITLSKPEVTNLDEAFISKTIKFIEENYDNAEMNIDDISASVGVSRSSFFKKIKGLTGMAPVDFIREFRLQKAAQMLEVGETNISQVAFNVGMNDTKYFSRCFKQKFGMNPSEYKSGINRKM